MPDGSGANKAPPSPTRPGRPSPAPSPSFPRPPAGRTAGCQYMPLAPKRVIADNRSAAARPGNPPGVIGLPFRKKALYYALLLFLTLLALEGMARIAYYAAYGQGYDGGRPELPATAPLALPDRAAATAAPWRIRHPFYGYTPNLPRHDLNEMPPRPRREDMLLVGLVGGSVAAEVQPFLEQALRRYFAANNLPRQPAVLNLTFWTVRQPQPTLLTAHNLLLGGEVDLLVNLDGLNEISQIMHTAQEDRVFPFFPGRWHRRVRLTPAELLLAGRIAILRREQARRSAVQETSPLRRSAAFGLANRWRQERTAAQIIRLNRELTTAQSAYSLEKFGPRSWLAAAQELRPAAARFWYRSSLMLSRLAAMAGADYYHFLQPNQYVPDAKPLSPAERESAYDPAGEWRSFVVQGYPLLRQFNRALPRAGVNYFDLTAIFADNRETLYRDDCCHLNDRGYALLAAEMVQRMAPALRRLGQDGPAAPLSALAAGHRPPPPDTLLVDGNFRVYLQGDGKYLRYARADCAAAAREARFFLHLTPRNLADLPPYRRQHGFDNLDFSFAEAGGRRWRGQCLAQIPLPPYPIAHLRTGQYAPDAGELWAGEFPFPE